MNIEDRLESSSRLKLLFVDADQRVLNSLRAMFRHDHDVIIATHVHEALQALDDASIDVVVADDRLPDTNGLDLLHWVRLRAPEAARILLVGAGEQPYDVPTIRRAQLFRVLSKPCAPDVLRATIAQAGRTARVGRASALVRAAASATQPDGAANDAPPEDLQGTRPVLSLSDDDSGLHRTLDGAEHTFGGTPRSPEASSPSASAPQVAASPASRQVSARGERAPELTAEEPVTPTLQGETPDVTGEVATTREETTPDEHSRPITRVWSSHGITVEEDAYDDPTDTQRVFASMLEDQATRPPQARSTVTSAVEVKATDTSAGTSVLPATPLARVPPALTANTAPGTPHRRGATQAAPAPSITPLVPTQVLLVSDDAITCAELRRTLERAHMLVDAASPEAALNAICSSACSVALVDGRGRSARSIERTARILISAAPELSILVFAEVAESGALFELPERVPGIISLLYALPTQQQLLGALAWASAVAWGEAREANATSAPLPPEATTPRHDALPSAAASGPAGGLLGDRLRRVSRFLTGAHDD